MCSSYLLTTSTYTLRATTNNPASNFLFNTWGCEPDLGDIQHHTHLLLYASYLGFHQQSTCGLISYSYEIHYYSSTLLCCIPGSTYRTPYSVYPYEVLVQHFERSTYLLTKLCPNQLGRACRFPTVFFSSSSQKKTVELVHFPLDS